MRIFTYRRIKDLAEALKKERTAEPEHPGSEQVYVVPTRADTEKLKDILLGTGGIDPSFPSIWRWGDIFREAQAASGSGGRRQIDPPDHWLIVRYIMDGILKEKDEPSYPPGVRQKGFISRLGQSLRELMNEEITPEELGRTLGCPGCKRDEGCSRCGEPEGILCMAYHRYSEYLEENSLCDSAQIATLTGDIVKDGPGRSWAGKRSFRFVGFLSFNHSQLEFVRMLERTAEEVSIYTPLTGIKGAYTVLSQFEDVPPKALGGRYSFPAIQVVGGDRRLEMETIARELVLWNNSLGEIAEYCAMPFPGWGNIAVTCPSDYTQLAEETFERYGIPFSLTEGLSVSRTALWELVSRTWECELDDWPPEKTERLLQEQQFIGSSFPVGKFERDRPSGKDEWRSFLMSQDPSMAGIFENMLRFGSLIRKGKNVAGLLQALKELFADSDSEIKTSAYILNIEELDESCRRFNAAIRETEEKMLSYGDLVERIGPAGEVPLKGSRAMEFLKNWAETSDIWNTLPLDDSVEIHPGTPPVLASSKVWIFAGVSAGNWPGILRETALLPDTRKEDLHSSLGLGAGHLPLISEIRRQREYLFRRIIACCENLCILSRPDADASGRPISESAFPDRAEKDGWILNKAGCGEKIERGLNRLLPQNDEAAIKGVEVREYGQNHHPGGRRVLPEKRLEADGKPLTVSLSSIDDWIKCPFLYYCRYILKIEERTVPGFDVKTAGTCLHRIWERSWRRYAEEGGSLLRIAAELTDPVLEETYRALLSDSHMKRHLAMFRKKIRKGGELQDSMEERSVRNTAISPVTEGELPELEIGGVTFTGRFDRLDILNDGSAVIMDYKSGGSARYGKNMQLAAYALLLEKGRGREKTSWNGISGYGYICHADGKIAGSSSGPAAAGYMGLSSRSAPLKERMEKASEYMERMAEDITEGRFAPDYESSYCRSCPYSGICRRQEGPEGEGENGERE